jgi:hypothetical protein
MSGRVFHLFLVVTLMGVSVASCAKAKASTEPVMPELAPPPPPPRVIERLPSDPVPVVEPGLIESALATPPEKPPIRPVPKVEPPKPEPPRPEPERPASTAPPLTLKPAPGVAAQTLASIRALLERAQRNLNRVKYAELNADGRAQYDTARGFMLQADEAIKSNNLAFAGKLADKAANMAEVLIR